MILYLNSLQIESKQRAQSAEREVQLLRRVRQLEQDTVKQTIKASSNASRDAVKEWNQVEIALYK